MANFSLASLYRIIFTRLTNVLTAGSNVTLTTSEDANTITIASTGGGGGGLDCAACSGDDLTIDGDLTVTGDNITMNTNTSGYILLAGGSNFAPSAPSSIGADLVSGQDAITVVAPAADYLLIWDATDSALKKVTSVNLGIGGNDRNNVVAMEIFGR